MKLSQAIRSGSTRLTPKAGALHFSGQKAGCALGMAVVGSGYTFIRGRRRRVRLEDRRTSNIETIFGPWLLYMVPRPCNCPAFLTLHGLSLKAVAGYFFGSGLALPREMRVKDVVAHIFDYHIMKKENWTLDQLVAWVERWEPREFPKNAVMDDWAHRMSRLRIVTLPVGTRLYNDDNPDAKRRVKLRITRGLPN